MSKELNIQLIERCKQGDERAQRELFDRYVDAMYNTVLRIVPEAMEAEDILQDGFIKAFSHLGQFRGRSTFGAWLKRIMINTALNKIKKQKIVFTSLDHEDIREMPSENEPESFPDPAQVHREILALPEGCRLIFTLYQLEGYAQKEIAKKLGVSLSTIKTQNKRARTLLQERLSNYHEQ